MNSNTEKNHDSVPTVYLGWADLRSNEGGGYNIYTRSVLTSNQKKETYYLRSTGKKSIVNALQKPMIVEDGYYLETRCFRIDYNPIICPTTHYYSDDYFSSHNLLPIIIDFINKFNIKKIIIQSHEGLPLHFISQVKKQFPSIRVVVYVHDAFYVCPKVHMFKYYQEPCFENNLGRDCKKCAQGDGGLKTKLAQIARKFQILKTIYKLFFKKNNHKSNLWQGTDYNERILKNISQTPERGTLLSAHRSLFNEGLSKADQIICFSHFYKTLLSKTYVGLNNVSVQRISLPHFGEISKVALAKNKAHSERTTICFHGSSNNSKGLDLLLKALSLNELWLEKKMDLKLLLNEPSDEVLEFEKQYKSRVSIIYNFNIQNLAVALSEADVSVFTSRLTENSPLTLLEALHAGHFIVAPHSGGTPEFLNIKYSELFRTNDSSDLSKAITRIYEKRKHIQNGKELVIASLKNQI